MGSLLASWTAAALVWLGGGPYHRKRSVTGILTLERLKPPSGRLHLRHVAVITSICVGSAGVPAPAEGQLVGVIVGAAGDLGSGSGTDSNVGAVALGGRALIPFGGLYWMLEGRRLSFRDSGDERDRKDFEMVAGITLGLGYLAYGELTGGLSRSSWKVAGSAELDDQTSVGWTIGPGGGLSLPLGERVAATLHGSAHLVFGGDREVAVRLSGDAGIAILLSR